MAYSGAILIATIGISVLTGLTFSPTAQSRHVAVIIAPWNRDGFAEVMQSGLMIVDTHWRRHVLVVDTLGRPGTVEELRRQGFWLLDATGTAFCGQDIDRRTT
jgi:hypothetical protein